MGTVSKTGPAEDGDSVNAAFAGALEDLRREFPGWTIDAWSASPADGRSGSPKLSASSYGELRRLLDKADALDCRQAIIAIADELKARGLVAQVYGLPLHTQTRAGIVRGVAARHGMFTWTTGVDIGPISDPAAARRSSPLPTS